MNNSCDAVEPTNIADVPRLLFLASVCRLWLREYTTLRTKVRRRGDRAVRRLPLRPNRWDWTSSGAPVMR
ncbi:MAG TPA: hypothetical protein VFB36_07255 [Nevskiaceae bacterium]|nr:hypothetical protein [Nevskiaceae bacterium]